MTALRSFRLLPLAAVLLVGAATAQVQVPVETAEDSRKLLAEAQALIPYALALSAASFLYVAFGDLLPRIHGQTDRRQRQWQYLMLVLGMAGIALIRLHHA